jgi:GT2 family glycosyltransferase
VSALDQDDLRAVVLTYGEGGEHRELLESLRREGLDRERVLIVHNPSAPGERAPGESGCETLLADHNLGYAAAMNLGIERQLERGAGLVLLLTHDARLRPGALAALLAAARAGAGFGALGPVLMRTGTETPYSFGGRDRGDGAVGHLTAAGPAEHGIAACDWVDGGTILLRAAALRAAGGFDERLWSYTEEAELCLRIRRAGFRVGVVLAARADQDPGGPKRPGPWAYLTTRNGLAYARRSVGPRGVAFVLGRALAVIGYELLRAGVRATRLRPGDRGEPWAVAVGMARGIVDYFRGRWGPPPTTLPGASDMTNLEPQA